MSKKSSTFVADLGIIPVTTYKELRNMETKCIFKCFAQDEWWYVYEKNIGVLLSNYRVYKGHTWYGHIAFDTPQYAIAAAINGATNGMEDCYFNVGERP